jgi:hypothetical protein
VDPRLVVAGAVVVGVGLRLFLAAGLPGNYDQASYELVVDIMRRGGNPYAETFRYNYSPFWAYCLLALSKVANRSHVELHLVVRGFLTTVDLLNAVLVGLIAHQVYGRPVWQRFSLYLVNPVAILIVGFHGQFETLAALPVLTAMYVHHRFGTTTGRYVWLLGTLAIVIKQTLALNVWTYFVYTFHGWRRAALLMLVAASVLAATLLPYLSALNDVKDNVLLYSGVKGIYGLELLLRGDWFGYSLVQFWSLPVFAVLAVLVPFVAVRRLHLSDVQGMEFAAVALVSLSPGIGSQWFILPALFGSILATRAYVIYSVVTGIYLLGSPGNLYLTPVPSMINSVWLVATGWLISYFVRWK